MRRTALSVLRGVRVVDAMNCESWAERRNMGGSYLFGTCALTHQSFRRTMQNQVKLTDLAKAPGFVAPFSLLSNEGALRPHQVVVRVSARHSLDHSHRGRRSSESTRPLAQDQSRGPNR